MRCFIVFGIIFLGIVLNVKSQSKSTIFIDSILIIYKNDTLLFKDLKKIYYVSNNKDVALSLYKNDSLEIGFDFVSNFSYVGLINHYFRKSERIPAKSKNYFIDPCGINVIEKKGKLSLSYDTTFYNEKYCGLYYFKFIKTNWKISNAAPRTINKIVVSFRLTAAIPQDTIAIESANRNGIWISSDYQDTIKVTFKDNLRNGKAIYTKPNGNYSLYYFKNDSLDGEISYYNKYGEQKGTPVVSKIPYVLTSMCPYKKK